MFIDIHVHAARHATLPRPGTREGWVTPEQVVAMYDQVGIAAGVLLPMVNVESTHILQSNEDALDIVAQHPGRFIPFCNLDPRLLYNTPKADLSYLLRHYQSKGCKGIGEVCANLPFADPRVDNLFHHAEQCGMPVTFHVASREGGTYGLVDQVGLPGLERALGRFPKLVFLAHSMGIWSSISGDATAANWMGYPTGPVTPGGRLVELLRRYPNLCGDLSAGSGCNAITRDPEFGYAFLAEFQDRLFFGTDVCTPSNRDTVLVGLKNFLEKALADGRLTRTVFDKITHRNAQRLLGLAG